MQSQLSAERPGELLEVERVAAALLIHGRGLGGIERLAQELAHLSEAERAEHDPAKPTLAARPLERGGQPLRHLAGPHSQREHHRRSRRPAQQCSEQLHRRRISPVKVIQYEH